MVAGAPLGQLEFSDSPFFEFAEVGQRDELHLALVSRHLSLARQRNLSHLTLRVAHLELSKVGKFQSESICVDVRTDFSDDAMRHRVDNEICFAVGTEVECLANPRRNGLTSGNQLSVIHESFPPAQFSRNRVNNEFVSSDVMRS